MSSQIKLPNPETIRDYVTQALSEVDMLNSGQYQWRTSIPVQMSDSDVRISNALYCVSPLLDELAAIKAENERLRAALDSVYRKANSMADYYPEPGTERNAYVSDAPEVFNDIRDTALKALQPK